MKTHIFLVLLAAFMVLDISAYDYRVLTLPRQEQLSSERVLTVMQDAEGFLWYATEGGGLCRDDGRQIEVFRSDAEHPELLGSNEVGCLAESGRHIIIGTFHGAYLLDKQSYTICQLTEVDENRVDDIIVDGDSHWWLTANKKVYEYAADGKWLRTIATGDKYIARLHEDRHGRLWATQWEGSLLLLRDGHFDAVAWPLAAAPTAIIDNPTGDGLWIGTVGQGVVHYDPGSGKAEPLCPEDNSICIDLRYFRDCLGVSTTGGLRLYQEGCLPVTADTPPLASNRLSLDLQGRLLVATSQRKSYAVSRDMTRKWFEGRIMTRFDFDSVRTAHNLSSRPTALARDNAGDTWFSTGKDIRHVQDGEETVVLAETGDVSAMTFTKDGTLWMATIFGTVMSYAKGKETVDEYASNEYGDAVTHMQTDSLGRLVMVSDHYVRLYDPVHRTLRQQNIEVADIYSLELQETMPDEHWSQPQRDMVVERLPQWVWWTLAMLVVLLSVLAAYIWQLHRQRKRFLEAMKKEVPAEEKTMQEERTDDKPALVNEWLQNAIAQMEGHLDDDSYSVEQLASDLCMSRMTFYRRIQSATGQKPTEFMRTIRLRRAADMLRKGNLNITEISYATGFSSVSYFSRCFRTMYGVPPTQFVDKCGKTMTAEERLPRETPS